MRLLGAYSLAVAAAALGALAGYWPGYAVIAAASLALWARDRLAGCTLLAASLASSKPESAAGLAILALAGLAHALAAPPGRPWGAPQTQRYTVVSAAVAALSLLNPQALAAVAGMLAGAAVRYAAASRLLSASRLSVRAPERVAMGESFPVLVEVSGPPGSYYMVRLEGLEERRGRIPGSGAATEEFRVAARHFGVIRLRAAGIIWDPLYTTGSPLPRAEARVVSYSRSISARRALARVLAGAAALVGRPRVLLEYQPEGRVGGGAGGWREAWGILEYAPVKPGYGPEVRGVRLYAPGDPPRLIYWKKTVSRHVMIVRDTLRSGGAGGGGVPGASNIVVADLRAWDWAELDSIVARLAETLGVLRGETIVYLRFPGGRAVLVKGDALSVANAVEGALTRNPPSPVMRLGPMPPPGYNGPPPGSGLEEAYVAVEAEAAVVAEKIAGLGVEPGASYTLIQSSLGRAWASALEKRLAGVTTRRPSPRRLGIL